MILEKINTILFFYINANLKTEEWKIIIGIFFAKNCIFIFFIFILIRIVINFKYLFFLKISLSTIFACLFSFLIKYFFFHPRPFLIKIGYQFIEHIPNTSFPSNHATILFTCAISFIMWDYFVYGIILIIIAFFMSFTRVYVGIHWPIDIIGGFFIGLYSCILCNYIHKLYYKNV